MAGGDGARLPDHFEADGLVLRRWGADDVTTLAEVVGRNLEHLRPWMPWIADEPLGLVERTALVERWTTAWSEGGDVILGIFEQGSAIGGTGLHRRQGPTTLEIGYWVDVGHVGRGVATRSSRVLARAALALVGIDAVEIHHDKANVASARVPAKLGFTFLGEVADERTAPAELGIDCGWRATSAWLDDERSKTP